MTASVENFSSQAEDAENNEVLATPADLVSQGKIKLTPEQEAEVDDLVDNKQKNYGQAIAEVLNLSEIKIREIQGLPPKAIEPESSDISNGATNDKPTHPEGGPYKDSYPIPVGVRQRGIGQEGEGKAATAYGPLKKTK
jgi:hypothetical protein